MRAGRRPFHVPGARVWNAGTARSPATGVPENRRVGGSIPPLGTKTIFLLVVAAERVRILSVSTSVGEAAGNISAGFRNQHPRIGEATEGGSGRYRPKAGFFAAVRRKCQAQRAAGGRPFGSAFFFAATTSG
jgi:hypothetical protein